MMPTHRKPNPVPEHRPRLRKSVEEAKQLLEERVRLGEDIARRLHPGAYVPGTLEGFRNEITRWSSYNRELLRQLFDTDEVANNYGRVFAAWVSHYDSEFERLRKQHDRVLDLVNDIKTVLDKLPLYESASGTMPLAIDDASTQARPSTVINISHSTFGTLNTGEVLGSIRSHVAGATGPSASAFREAIEALASEIATDESLPEERRKEALESIDYAAEASSQSPETRRIAVLRSTLSAIPATLELSARALEAWDKYGGPIRAHLGL